MITLYNENCFDRFSIMSDNSVDIVFTSPPYNRKRNDKYTHYNDTLVDYYSFLENMIIESLRVASQNVFINIQKNYYNKVDVFKIIDRFADDICEVFTWEKSNPMPAAGYGVTNSYEWIIAMGKPLVSNRTYTKNILTTSGAKMPSEHKAVMHPLVADYFVGNFSKTGMTIYDPFMGVGTTAISCHKHDVNCVGTEIVKEYYDMSISNILKHTLIKGGALTS